MYLISIYKEGAYQPLVCAFFYEIKALNLKLFPNPKENIIIALIVKTII